MIRTNRVFLALAASLVLGACTNGESGVAGLTAESQSESLGPMRDGSQPITNAAEYLAELDVKWRGVTGIEDPEDAVVGDGAQCYYILDKVTEVFNRQAACGPVRRAGTDDGSVWDIYSVKLGSDGPTLDAPASDEAPGGNTKPRGPSIVSADKVAGSATRPAGKLYRPDGAVPEAGADAIPAPAHPRADSALLGSFNLSGKKLSKSVTIDPNTSVLITPSGTVSLTQVSEVASVDAVKPIDVSSAAIDRPTDPAPGHRFVVFTLKLKSGWPSPDQPVIDTYGYSPPDLPKATYTFIDDGLRTDITDELKAGDTGNTFVASVKDGAPAQIGVSIAGLEQTLTVDTATRDDNPQAQTFYLAKRSQAVGASQPTFVQSLPKEYGSTANLRYEAQVKTVTFSAYDPNQGWAPPGQRWVQVIVKQDFAEVDNYSTDNWVITADEKKYTPAHKSKNMDALVASYLVPDTTKAITGSFATVLNYMSWNADLKANVAGSVSAPAIEFTATAG
ncbi:hypothetical protein EH165_12740 [Nakamurella antarctica]|uniref:Lipoprotein n=1 Tax=Nakamurella antarctica TaxID=1902245 RepID=A0A3G8ZXZ2_9ACTN|nr:hypothetical protein [Nakamurella antarctica]AZI58876.1 hypothetical protein EH165_12740 [Nakamurella antarctica]